MQASAVRRHKTLTWPPLAIHFLPMACRRGARYGQYASLPHTNQRAFFNQVSLWASVSHLGYTTTMADIISGARILNYATLASAALLYARFTRQHCLDYFARRKYAAHFSPRLFRTPPTFSISKFASGGIVYVFAFDAAQERA